MKYRATLLSNSYMYRIRHVLLCTGILGAGCGGGCSRAERDAASEPVSAADTMPVPRREERSTARPGSPGAPVADRMARSENDASGDEPRPAPFRVVTISGHEEESHARAGLVSSASGTFRIVSVGDMFDHFRVTAIDPEREAVLLDRAGIVYRATSHAPAEERRRPVADWPTEEDVPPGHVTALQAAAEADAYGEPAIPESYRFDSEPTGETRLQRAVRAREEAVFVPTESEWAEGIDPNDPETWPEHYRGPEIERQQPTFP